MITSEMQLIFKILIAAGLTFRTLGGLKLKSGQLLPPVDKDQKDQKKKVKKKRHSSSRRKGKTKVEETVNNEAQDAEIPNGSKNERPESNNNPNISKGKENNSTSIKDTKENKENEKEDAVHEEKLTTSMFGDFKFTENHNDSKETDDALVEDEETEHESMFNNGRSPLNTVKKTIKSRNQVLREDKTSRILAPILRNWNGKPNALDKVKSSVKKINDIQAKNNKNILASPKQPSKKIEHFWDEGNLKETEESTFTGFRKSEVKATDNISTDKAFIVLGLGNGLIQPVNKYSEEKLTEAFRAKLANAENSPSSAKDVCIIHESFQIPEETKSKKPSMKPVLTAPVESEDLKKFRFRKMVENKKGSIKVATVFSQNSKHRQRGRRM